MSDYDGVMWRATLSLAFFGLLRISEYAAPSIFEFDPLIHLCFDDVSFVAHGSVLLVRLKGSKTDPFRMSTTLRIASTGHRVCPVTAMLEFLKIRHSGNPFLFAFKDGQLLTRERVVLLLRAAFPENPNLNTHSFRRGGASALAAAGYPPYVIRILG